MLCQYFIAVITRYCHCQMIKPVRSGTVFYFYFEFVARILFFVPYCDHVTVMYATNMMNGADYTSWLFILFIHSQQTGPIDFQTLQLHDW